MPKEIKHIRSLTQLHDLFGYAKPKHPLISVVDFSNINVSEDIFNYRVSKDFYSISFNEKVCPMMYGRFNCDFEEGAMVFMAPNQLISVDSEDVLVKPKGWALYFHPDLIRSSHLKNEMENYSFFSYEMKEALHLSDDEKNVLNECVRNLINEYSQPIDRHSQKLLISNLEIILNYCLRFFERQFITRHTSYKGVFSQFDDILNAYFNDEYLGERGLPTVNYLAEQVNLSPNYLSDLIKKETGRNAQEHIHLKLIDKAKNLLINSDLSIKEIAFDLGFKYPHYFSRIFKLKTGETPLNYRSLNLSV